MSLTWSQELSNALRAIWGKMPAPQIGEILFGTPAAKNAVIGKAHRMELGPGYQPPLSDDKKAVYTREFRARNRAIAAVVPVVRAKRQSPRHPVPVVPKEEKLAPLLSGHACQWPLGDPRTKGFKLCGDPASLGKPYCPKHCKDAYQPR